MTTAPRGAADRVALVHRQSRRTLALAAVFAAIAPVAAVVPHSTGAWLPLHLFLVGSLLCAISGATQMLSVTWSSSPAPPATWAAVQRWSIALGAVAVAAGRELEIDAVTGIGGAAVAVGLGLLAVLLHGIRRGAVTDRYFPAIEAYLAAIGFGLVGVVVGVGMATATPTARWDDLRAAHLTVNLFGLVGLVIAGTLPFFTATQARMKMFPGATPARVRRVVAGLALATLMTALGRLVDRSVVAAIGLAGYAVGLGAIGWLLPRFGRRQLDWAGPRLLQLLAGLAWWALTSLVLAARALDGGGDDGPILRALVVGGFAQILVAALAYLGPVIRGGGHERLSAGFALTRSWVTLVAANIAAIGALFDAPAVLGVALAVWLIDSLTRAVILARPASPGPVPESPTT